MQAEDYAEAIAQRSRQCSEPRGGADDGEGVQRQAYAAGGGTLADDQVEREVFHRGVEALFDYAAEAVDLVDEEYVAAFERGEDRGEVAGVLDGWPGGHADGGLHLGGDDQRERGFA